MTTKKAGIKYLFQEPSFIHLKLPETMNRIKYIFYYYYVSNNVTSKIKLIFLCPNFFILEMPVILLGVLEFKLKIQSLYLHLSKLSFSL